ncbi:MAG: L,D-transpeptidase [Chloroflexota bacterium]
MGTGSTVPPSGPYFYVDQLYVHYLMLPMGAKMHVQAQHLYTFLNGALVNDYAVSTGVGGSTPVRSGTLGPFDRGKILRAGDPGWIVQGGVYVDDFWPLFPPDDQDSQILIHTLPFQPNADGTHDAASYYGETDLGQRPSSAGCIRMWPAHLGHYPGFGRFTSWAKRMQAAYRIVPFSIGA